MASRSWAGIRIWPRVHVHGPLVGPDGIEEGHPVPGSISSSLDPPRSQVREVSGQLALAQWVLMTTDSSSTCSSTMR
jgi:hypothetical protein